MIIRSATADDWHAIWPIFRTTVEAGDSYAFPADLTSEQARDLWMEYPPGQTVVAVDGERVLGTAKMGPNRGGRGAHVATASFMVAPESRGQQVGRTLGNHVIDWATRQGYRGIQFNAVVETNTPAVALWQHLGFQIVGTVPEAFEHPVHGFVGLHVMYLGLPVAGVPEPAAAVLAHDAASVPRTGVTGVEGVAVTDATPDDLAEIAALADERRQDYQSAQPVFWRVATDAIEQHTPFLASLISDPSVVSLVARDGERVAGYLIASLVAAPPVYAPGGPSGFVDDFAVATTADWPRIGTALLDEARRRLADLGATQIVAVCGLHDTAKLDVLRTCGLTPVSAWLVAQLESRL